MASEKKIQTHSTPKSEPAPKEKSASDVAPAKVEKAASEVAPAKAEKGASDVASTKAEKSDTPSAAAPANYSRGEGQKPVSQAYRDNWNVIFAKKTKKKR
ncbi:MAG: hypothetical protein WA177_17540 [Xanthobacteraceae bacterium]